MKKSMINEGLRELGIIAIPVVGVVYLVRAPFIGQRYELRYIRIAGLLLNFVFSFALVRLVQLGSVDRLDITVANSELQLKILTGEIEKYHEDYGEYPKDFSQMDFAWAPVNGNDPIQIRLKRQDPRFRYIKAIEGYYLFSAGLDGVDYTKDDLLPDTSDIVGRVGLLIDEKHLSQ